MANPIGNCSSQLSLVALVVRSKFPTRESLLQANLNNMLGMKIRNRRIVEARLSGRTLEEVGDEFGLTRERIRQIVVALGHGNYKTPPTRYLCTCQSCRREFLKEYPKKYCSAACWSKDTPLGKPQKEFTKEDWQRYNKIRNEETREYRKAYYHTPAVQARMKARQKTPAYRAYHREYYHRPYVQKKRELYMRRPEVMEKQRLRMREYYQRPEVKERLKLYRSKRYAEQKAKL